MATLNDQDAAAAATGALAPLRERTYRRIWFASLFSNTAQLFLSVAAAWEMTRLTDSPSMVALVQTALFIPVMILTPPAGAIADMFDKRKTAILGLVFAALSAAGLALLSFLDANTPWLLLGFCVLVGTGWAIYLPSWQAGVPEQVSRANLPAAVSLGAISVNVARSFGPALGGVIVVTAGVTVVFAITSLLFAPLLLAFYAWKRAPTPARLPPERIDRAVLSGARYAFHSVSIRTTLARVFLFALTSAAAMALAPLVAKNLLAGNASTFGMLLGAQGVGAVLAALTIGKVRSRFRNEVTVRSSALLAGLALMLISFSHFLVLTLFAYFLVGISNMLSVALLNVSIQMSAPRWVTARAIALFSSALTIGFGCGAWIWGLAADIAGLRVAFQMSGMAVMVTALVGLILPLRADRDTDDPSAEIGYEPSEALGLNYRSGPIVVEIEYDVDPDQARDFYNAMRNVQIVRKRNGGFQWSLARDVENPALWIERYLCPTWGDYLRMRSRYTQTDIDRQAEATAFNRAPGGLRVTRRLERPFGSVRWKEETPDPQQETVDYIGP